MTTVVILAATIAVTLALVSLLAGRRDGGPAEAARALQLLPGDLKYESPSGSFRLYFPITTSIVLSIVLTLVLRLLG